MMRSYPFPHGFGAFAIITGLAQQLKIAGPVRAPARQRGFVIDCWINYQKADPAPARKPLFVQEFVYVFDRVMALGPKFDGFTSSDVHRTNSGIGVIPRFAGSFGSFGVASVPMVSRVSTALFATTRRRITRRIVIFWARFSGSIKRLPKALGNFSWAGHGCIEPLAGGFVK